MDTIIFLDRIGYTYFLPSIVFIAFAVYEYNYFFQNDNFQDTSWSDWTVAAGYTVAQFFGLLLGTIFFPLGIMATLIFALQSFKYTDKYYHVNLFIYAFLSITFFTCSGLVYNYMDAKGMCIFINRRRFFVKLTLYSNILDIRY